MGMLFKVVDKDWFTSNDTVGIAKLSAKRINRNYTGFLPLEPANKKDATNGTMAGRMGISPEAELSCCCFSGIFSLAPRPSGGRLEVKVQIISEYPPICLALPVFL